MQLALQRLQLRLDQARLELRRLERAPFGLAAIRERVREADEEQIRHQQPVELPDVVAAGAHPERALHRRSG